MSNPCGLPGHYAVALTRFLSSHIWLPYMLTCLCTGASCRTYPPSLLDPVDAAGGPDAGTMMDAKPDVGPYGNGIGWWSLVDDAGCISTGVPKPEDHPVPTPSEPASLDPVYFALSRLFVGINTHSGQLSINAWKDLGLDLDGVCTLSPTCPIKAGQKTAISCKAATASIPPDGNQCRDNTYGSLLTGVLSSSLGPQYGLSGDLDCGLCLGYYTLLFKLSNYNGTSNDSQVRADLYTSSGLEQPLSAFDCSVARNNRQFCWHIGNPWNVLDSSMPNPQGGPHLPDAHIFDAAAYVRDSYLVMHLPPNSYIWFPQPSTGPSIQITPLMLQRGVLVSKIDQALDGTWELMDGTLAGALKAEDMIHGLRSIGLCENDPKYPFVRPFLNQNLDVLVSGQNNPNMPCDGLSIGLGFEAQQATPGTLVHKGPPQECASSMNSGGAAGSVGAAGGGGGVHP